MGMIDIDSVWNVSELKSVSNVGGRKNYRKNLISRNSDWLAAADRRTGSGRWPAALTCHTLIPLSTSGVTISKNDIHYQKLGYQNETHTPIFSNKQLHS